MITPDQQQIMECLGDERATIGQIAAALQIDVTALTATLVEMEREDLVCSAIRLVDDVGYEFWQTYQDWREVIRMCEALKAFQARALTIPSQYNQSFLPEWDPLMQATRDLLILLSGREFDDQTISNVAALLLHSVQMRPQRFTLERQVKRIRRYARRMRSQSGQGVGQE